MFGVSDRAVIGFWVEMVGPQLSALLSNAQFLSELPKKLPRGLLTAGSAIAGWLCLEKKRNKKWQAFRDPALASGQLILSLMLSAEVRAPFFDLLSQIIMAWVGPSAHALYEHQRMKTYKQSYVVGGGANARVVVKTTLWKELASVQLDTVLDRSAPYDALDALSASLKQKQFTTKMNNILANFDSKNASSSVSIKKCWRFLRGSEDDINGQLIWALISPFLRASVRPQDIHQWIRDLLKLVHHRKKASGYSRYALQVDEAKAKDGDLKQLMPHPIWGSGRMALLGDFLILLDRNAEAVEESTVVDFVIWLGGIVGHYNRHQFLSGCLGGAYVVPQTYIDAHHAVGSSLATWLQTETYNHSEVEREISARSEVLWDSEHEVAHVCLSLQKLVPSIIGHLLYAETQEEYNNLFVFLRNCGKLTQAFAFLHDNRIDRYLPEYERLLTGFTNAGCVKTRCFLALLKKEGDNAEIITKLTDGLHKALAVRTAHKIFVENFSTISFVRFSNLYRIFPKIQPAIAEAIPALPTNDMKKFKENLTKNASMQEFLRFCNEKKSTLKLATTDALLSCTLAQIVALESCQTAYPSLFQVLQDRIQQQEGTPSLAPEIFNGNYNTLLQAITKYPPRTQGLLCAYLETPLFEKQVSSDQGDRLCTLLHCISHDELRRLISAQHESLDWIMEKVVATNQVELLATLVLEGRYAWLSSPQKLHLLATSNRQDILPHFFPLC